MRDFILRRLLAMILTIIAVSFAVFLLIETNTDGIATSFLGPYSSAEQRSLWLTQHGYDAPLIQRYITWIFRVLRLDFGESIVYKTPVTTLLLPRLANTGLLALLTLTLVATISLVLGLLAGLREGSLRDRIISTAGILTTSVPEFVSAVFLTAVLVIWLDWLPGTSSMINGFDPKQLILPALVLVLYDFGYVTRMTRISVIEVVRANYVRTAILKGLPRHIIVTRHILRNALIIPFTVLTLQVNWLLSGVIVVEVFFAYKGFGALLLEASLNKDVFVIEACALVAVIVAVTSQALADIGYVLLNPRMSLARS